LTDTTIDFACDQDGSVSDSWIVKVEIRDPLAIPDAPNTGPLAYTEADVEKLRSRLRDGLPMDSPRRLGHAILQDGVIIGFFETSAEPSLAQCQEFYRLTIAALPPFRRPRTFKCVKTYPVGQTEVTYLG
jgi:hypothetical protein